MAHGYLLSSFISPYTNQRQDDYGGTVEKRMRFPLEIFSAVRAIWPKEKPISVRISATDWVEGGLSNAEMLKVASLLKEAKVDIINVSTGQVTKKERPIYGRMFQVPYADQIRNELRVPTIVAGNFTSADQANTVIAAGRCDMVAMGRSIMNEPHFVLNAATHYGHHRQAWAPQYMSGRIAAEAHTQTEQEEIKQLRLAARPPNPSEALVIAMARGEMLLEE